MARAKVSPKYQIVIPKDIRRQVNLKSGQVVHLIVRNGFITLIPDQPLESLRGIAKGISTDDFRDEQDRF